MGQRIDHIKYLFSPCQGSWGRAVDRFFSFCLGEDTSDWLSIFKDKINAKGAKNFTVSDCGKFAKEAWQETNAKIAKENIPFYKRIWNMIKPSGWADDIKSFIGKPASNGKTIGKCGAFFRAVGKRMPLIGTLLAVGFEIPNIFRAFTHKDGGIGTGVAETGKAVLKTGAMGAGFAAGAAIGTAIFPGAGTLIGGAVGFISGIIGSSLALKAADGVLGKSFTEKQEEKQQQEAIAQQKAQEMLMQGGVNPFMNQSQQGVTNPQQIQQMQNFKTLDQLYREYAMMQQALQGQCMMNTMQTPYNMNMMYQYA
ncbi:hypothetical protein J6Q66_00530 [bacterium]|nr:hypothetical protein [bacterium]